jgi:hypothetical protein
VAAAAGSIQGHVKYELLPFQWILLFLPTIFSWSLHCCVHDSSPALLVRNNVNLRKNCQKKQHLYIISAEASVRYGCLLYLLVLTGVPFLVHVYFVLLYPLLESPLLSVILWILFCLTCIKHSGNPSHNLKMMGVDLH